MSGFANAILGGAANLIRKAIASPNYSPGVSGWSINKDGTAEFANAIIRGTIKTGDTQYILIESGPNGNRIQFFSGDPAEVSPGVVQVGQPTAGQATLTVQAPDLGFGQPPALTLTSGALETDNNADLSSPYSLSESGEIWSGFFSQLYDLTADTINLSGIAGGINLDGGPGGINTATVLNANDGIQVPAGEYIRRGTLATPTLLNGWGNFGGTFQPVRYAEFPDCTAGIVGVASGGTTTGGTGMFTIPVGLRPTNDHTFDAPCNAGKHTQILITSAGSVVIQNPDTGITWIAFGNIRWPIAGF